MEWSSRGLVRKGYGEKGAGVGGDQGQGNSELFGGYRVSKRSSGHVRVWELDYKESWAQKNWCFWTVVLEKTLESPLDCKEIQPVHPKGDQSWVFIGRTDVKLQWSWNSDILATWCEELTHWKRPWCWERLEAGGEGDDRRWDGWMASPTQWTWVWVNSWVTLGRPSVLQSIGSQRVRHDWVTELTELINCDKSLVLTIESKALNSFRHWIYAHCWCLCGFTTWQSSEETLILLINKFIHNWASLIKNPGNK